MGIVLSINAQAEVIIEYRIILHEDNLLVDKNLLLSDGLTMIFNEKKARIQKLGQTMISSFDLYAFEKDYYYQCANFMGQKKAFKHNRKLYKIDSVFNETFNILNIPCKKAVGQKIEIYFTDIYGVAFHPNVKINGIALLYTIDDDIFGKISYQAVSITIGDIGKEMFNKKGYTLSQLSKPKQTKSMQNKRMPKVSAKNLEGKSTKIVH